MSKEELVAALNEAEAQELTILAATVENTKNKMLTDSTESAIKAYDAAKKAMARFEARIEDRLGGGELEPFDSMAAAHRWLQEQGYKIGRAKFYKDMAEWGLAEKNTPVSRVAVAEYITRAKLKLAVQPATPATGEVEHDEEAVREREVRRRIEEEKLVRLKRQNERDAGKMVLRTDHVTDMAVLAGVIESMIKQRLVDEAARMIELVGGSPTKEFELVELFKEVVNDEFRQLSTADEIVLEVGHVG